MTAFVVVVVESRLRRHLSNTTFRPGSATPGAMMISEPLCVAFVVVVVVESRLLRRPALRQSIKISIPTSDSNGAVVVVVAIRPRRCCTKLA